MEVGIVNQGHSNKTILDKCLEELNNLTPEKIKKLQEDFDNDNRDYSLPEGLELILPDSLK